MIWVSMPHATFGLVVKFPEAVIVMAPPISRRSLGRPAREVWDYYAKRGTVLWIP
jgi:hypothetical protein